MMTVRAKLLLVFILILAMTQLVMGEEEKGGLVEEKTLSPGEMNASLNLTVTGMPETAHPLDIMILENGEWWLREQLDDRPLYLESRRLPAAEFDTATLERLITMEWPQAREITFEQFPELAERLSYPALKAAFLNGENEDTDRFAAAMVFADGWSFLFVLEADADAETHDETLEQEMESILLGIDVVDPENGDFLPGPGLPVYGSGAALPESPTTMDALIRVKKVVAPEDGLEGGLAYRNDGLEEIDGRPALALVFGGDSPEKFTAERYFAVDEAGAVYEWDQDEGREYRRVGESADEDGNLPMWVGLFRKDGITLEIGMYRKGPYGYYFGGLFSGEGIEDRQVLAAVDGRIASEEHLSFVLDDDDSAITVSVNEGADEALQQLAGRYVESDEGDADGEDNGDSGESAVREFPLVNKLGFTIASIHIDSFGSGPIATDVADGATVMLDDTMWWELRRGSRLFVKNAEDENDSAPPLQFQNDAFPEETDSFELDRVDGVPELQFFEDGRQIDWVAAGLPLEELLYGLEPGMEPGKYADFMTPPEADGWESYPFAVRTGLSVWRLLPPGPVFTEDADGVRRLSAVSFGQDNRRIDITINPNGAFGGLWHFGRWLAAKTAEEGKGLPERYVLNDDGTFVRATSDFVALEQERELFAAGTWTVTDNELLLNVRERWMLPVGGMEHIVPDGMTTIVDGDVVKVLFNPPEKEAYPIARAKKDPETDRLAITIDGTTYYNFDGQSDAGVDFLKRYNELRRAQKIDFSNLKDVVFTFSSGAGAWRTNLTIQPDGAFNGQYSDADMGSRGDGYPNGTVYICDFSGAFSPLEKADEAGYSYTLKCGTLSQEGTPEEEQIIDSVRYVNAEPYGLENAAGENACTLYVPGTPYDTLPESFFEDRGIELEDVETSVLGGYVLRIPSDGSEDSHDEYFYGAVDDSDYRFYSIDWE